MGEQINSINPNDVLLSICKQFNALQATINQLCEAYNNTINQLNKQIEELKTK